MKIRELIETLNAFKDKERDVSILILEEEENINVDIDEVRRDEKNNEAYLCVNT